MDRATLVHRLKIAGTWLPALFLSFVFIRAGLDKFSDTSGWARAFRYWGYPDWFRITIGVLEVAAVPLLLSWKWAAYGAIIIIVVMLGAMGTHIAYDGGRNVTSEMVPLFLGCLVLYLHRRSLWSAPSAPVGGVTENS